MRRRQPKVAGLGVRARAWAIDAGVVLGIAGAALGAGMGGAKLARRSPELERLIQPLLAPWRPNRPLRLVMLAATAVAAVAGRNSRGLGSRKLGLRKAEARTGGRVTVRAALIHWGVSVAWNELTDLPFKPMTKRAERRLREVHAEIEEIKRRHPDDAEARNAAMAKVYRDSGVNPFGSCGWTLGKIVLRQVPILVTPKHQSVPDLVAGLVIVEE